MITFPDIKLCCVFHGAYLESIFQQGTKLQSFRMKCFLHKRLGHVLTVKELFRSSGHAPKHRESHLQLTFLGVLGFRLLPWLSLKLVAAAPGSMPEVKSRASVLG